MKNKYSYAYLLLFLSITLSLEAAKPAPQGPRAKKVGRIEAALSSLSLVAKQSAPEEQAEEKEMIEIGADFSLPKNFNAEDLEKLRRAIFNSIKKKSDKKDVSPSQKLLEETKKIIEIIKAVEAFDPHNTHKLITPEFINHCLIEIAVIYAKTTSEQKSHLPIRMVKEHSFVNKHKLLLVENILKWEITKEGEEESLVLIVDKNSNEVNTQFLLKKKKQLLRLILKEKGKIVRNININFGDLVFCLYGKADKYFYHYDKDTQIITKLN